MTPIVTKLPWPSLGSRLKLPLHECTCSENGYPAACYWRADVVEALQYNVGPTDGTESNGWRWDELSSLTHTDS